MPSLAEVSKSNPFSKPVVAASGEVEFGSNEYYAKCAIGGAISCGATHTLIVPLDLVKCRMQVDQAKYPNMPTAFKVTFPQIKRDNFFAIYKLFTYIFFTKIFVFLHQNSCFLHLNFLFFFTPKSFFTPRFFLFYTKMFLYTKIFFTPKFFFYTKIFFYSKNFFYTKIPFLHQILVL